MIFESEIHQIRHVVEDARIEELGTFGRIEEGWWRDDECNQAISQRDYQNEIGFRSEEQL